MSTNKRISPSGTLQVLKYDVDRKLVFFSKKLEDVLLKNDIKDREVAVISIAGVYRSGKSFMLNFFLRYLYSRYRHQKTDKEWLGKQDETLDGFTWSTGSDRVTTGIHIWSDIFLHDYPNGRKIAIILMDTQGTFDSESLIDECTRIFALSTLLSTVQIYNISKNLQEDDLQNLQLFSEYGQMAAEKGIVPFQKLLFLVRDWMMMFEHAYGQKGGEALLQKRLAISDSKHPDLKSIRTYIRSCFDDISCFLMPFPGMQIIRNEKFDGKLSDIDEDFQTSLLELVPLLLAPENLITKKINNKVVTVKEFFVYFKQYVQTFQSDKLPCALTVGEATAKVYNEFTLTESEKFYKKLMSEKCGPQSAQMEPELLEAEHIKIKTVVLLDFAAKDFMNADKYYENLKKKLQNFIEAEFIEYQKLNKAKVSFMKTFLTGAAAAVGVAGLAAGAILLFFLGFKP